MIIDLKLMLLLLNNTITIKNVPPDQAANAPQKWAHRTIQLPNWDAVIKNWKIRSRKENGAKSQKMNSWVKTIASRLLTPLLFLAVQHLTKLTLFT